MEHRYGTLQDFVRSSSFPVNLKLVIVLSRRSLIRCVVRGEGRVGRLGDRMEVDEEGSNSSVAGGFTGQQ